MFPKCGILGCGSRDYRLVGTLPGKKPLFMYQCSNGHVHLLDTEIVQVQNPLTFLVKDPMGGRI